MDQAFQPSRSVLDFGNGWLAGSAPPTSALVGSFYFQGNGTVWVRSGLGWAVFGSLVGPPGQQGPPALPSLSFLLPTMTTAQKNALVGRQAGSLVFDVTLGKGCLYNGSGWETITSA